MLHPQPTLRQFQKLLWRFITVPDEERQELKKSAILPVRGDRRLSAFERVDIYARMYFWRIVDSLKEDFPSLWQLMEEDEFDSLIRAYLKRYPSSHWTLRNVGQHLPVFLKQHALLKKWPFLVDLARFEWEMIEVFDDQDTAPLREEHLQSVPPTSWGGFNLQLIPAHRLLRCRWPVDRIREGILSQGTWAGRPQTTLLQVWRKDYTLSYRTVDRLEFSIMRMLQQRTRFDTLCGQVMDQVGQVKAPQVATAYLQSWLRDQILAY